MNYLITTGWWCTEDQNENRFELIGDNEIRGKEFHKIWYDAIKETKTKAKIYIIDSCSPIKPDLNAGEEIISLEKNFGHSTRCSYKLSGVTRAHSLGMMIALLNEYEYWVYIEQDALIYGEKIIEDCISSMKKPMAFGNGKGTPYPLQQSFMIIKASHIVIFLSRLLKIKSSDKEISPELKFCIASSIYLSMIPEFIYKFIEKRGLLNKIIRIFIYWMIGILRGYQYLPYGYGRTRPINYNDKNYYFQHGSKEEIDEFLKRKISS